MPVSSVSSPEKQRGASAREKARLQVARLHERISNQRQDVLHKLSSQLVRDYDFIAIEDLAPKNMVRNPQAGPVNLRRFMGRVSQAVGIQGRVVRETGGHD